MTEPTEDTFTVWRRSYKRLRVLEVELVSRSRSRDDHGIFARLYEKVEALRQQTTDLFQLAQTAGMAHQIPVARRSSMSLETTPSEFSALHDD